MAAIPGAIPASLGVSGSSGSAIYTRTSVAYNYSIGGLPFLSAASRENPYIRNTAEYRKQQFDNSGEPGEQSISGWWLRSQQSYHGGAGQLFGDVGANESPTFTSVRFWDSEGVDPWVPGQVSLLRSTTSVGAAVIKAMVPYTNVGTEEAFGISSSLPYKFNGVTGAVSEASPSAKTLQSVAYDGTSLYVSALDGIWSRPKAGGAYTKIWNIPTDQVNVIKWVKQRLVLAASSGVYELTGVGPALPVAKWVAPTAGFTPVGIAESANSIYVAGNSGMDAFILRFTLDTSGVMPSLTSGAVVANLPFGETLTAMYGYLGTYLALGTSRGARIARIDTSGAIEVGPLLWETGAVNGWYARDHFLYATGSTQENGPGLYRVDLASEIGNLRFAYAKDLVAVAGGSTVYSVCGQGSTNKLLVGCSGGVYAETDSLIATGWIQSSRIRFDTLEPKVFKLLRVRTPQLGGGIRILAVDSADTEYTLIGFAESQTPGDEDIVLPALGPQDYLSIKVELDANTGLTDGAEMTGWQLKALPAMPRERMIQVPLLCYDSEKDRNGVRCGGIGTAVQRLEALEDLERSADVISFQDLDLGRTTRCVIDQLNFHQTAPPTNGDGWGGIITLTLRTV
jgi:hypothetical protein